jgi:hypothetical protein
MPDSATPRAASGLARLARRAFWVWVVVSFLVAGSLGLAHTFALSAEAIAQPALAAAIAETRRPEERGQWLALHVLYSRCRCSQRTLAALSARRPLPLVRERVVLVGAHAGYEATARAAGFAVEVIAPEALAPRYHLAAAPVFVVADPAGALRYVGGYTARKQGLASEDAAILARAMRGDPVRALPLFGCAVSRQLSKLLDPFGLRSAEGEG